MQHSSQVDAQAEHLDFVGFAQEFLRRNKDYRRQFATLGALAEQNPFAPDCREVARTWGLRFPNKPKHFCRSQSGDLAA